MNTNKIKNLLFLSLILMNMQMVYAMKVETKDAPVPIGPYSQAIQTDGGMLFVSGQLPVDPSTNELITDIKKATAQIMDYIGAILKAAQADYGNIVKTTIYLTDMSYFADVNQVYASYFKEDKPYPARETVCVKALPKGALIEISVVACK